ncbi:MAG: hypothetical protein ACK4ZE_03345 [Sphingorhabdus sp.]
MPSLSHKRGTRAQVDAAASANALRLGEVYLITDEARLTVGISASAHQPAAKQGEGTGDPWTWVKLTADVANSTVAPAAATGLSFAAAANMVYLVEVVGTFQSAATTTGIALALDIPSGAVSGMTLHPASATTLTGTEQIADATTTGATTGVRAAATNIPIRANFIVSVGAIAGQVQLLFRSEVAASAVTLKAGLTAMGRRII